MTRHWSFIKGPDDSFGMFYPRNYIVAGYGSQAHADAVVEQFRAAGFGDDEVAAASGEFMIEQVESSDHRGWLDRLKRQIAGIAGTEAGYVEDDIALAHEGGAFVFIHAPHDADLQRARRVLEKTDPVFARRYLALGIERLIYPPQAEIGAQARAAHDRDAGTRWH